MLEAIARVTPKPVRLAIVTHAVQEFLFGNAAFAERGIPLLRARQVGRSHAQPLRALPGELEQGARPTAHGGLAPGAARRAPWRLHGPGGRRAEPAAAVFRLGRHARRSGRIRSGQRRAVRRRPGEQSAASRSCATPSSPAGCWRWTGWRRSPRAGWYPGTGRCRRRLRSRRRALTCSRSMRESARSTSSGASLLEAVDSVDLPQYEGWDMYPATHRRNAHQRYLELELAEFGDGAQPPVDPVRPRDNGACSRSHATAQLQPWATASARSTRAPVMPAPPDWVTARASPRTARASKRSARWTSSTAAWACCWPSRSARTCGRCSRKSSTTLFDLGGELSIPGYTATRPEQVDAPGAGAGSSQRHAGAAQGIHPARRQPRRRPVPPGAHGVPAGRAPGRRTCIQRDRFGVFPAVPEPLVGPAVRAEPRAQPARRPRRCPLAPRAGLNAARAGSAGARDDWPRGAA